MVETTVLLTAAAMVTLIGFGWLALAMESHWEQVHGAAPLTPGAVRALRIAGALGLTLSLGLCLAVDHPSMAALVWLMLMAGAAPAVAMTLATRPRLLRCIWPATACGE